LCVYMYVYIYIYIYIFIYIYVYGILYSIHANLIHIEINILRYKAMGMFKYLLINTEA
jgi:hypothetical protein